MKLYLVKIVKRSTREYSLMVLREDDYNKAMEENDEYTFVELVRCVDLTAGEILQMQDGEFFVG